MSTKFTRREILQFVGGSALGLLLSPIPWKVLDDAAIWTQNWPWTPAPARGDIAYRLTTCTLCQASCGMRSRTVGLQPVSLSGIQRHPFNHGSLCTTGILAHHLRYHPARAKHPVKCTPRTAAQTDLPLTEAFREIGSALKQSTSVVILDERPGRTVSECYRELASLAPNVRYVPSSARGLDALNNFSGNASLQAGYDVDAARVILSFGAPLFDGWGSPSRTSAYLDKRPAQKLIQCEPIRSRTAELAGQWIPVRPGSEAMIALSIARVMVEEGLASAPAANAITDIGELRSFLAAYTPEAVSTSTGVPSKVIRETARAFAFGGPSLAIAGHDTGAEARSAAMLLNIMAGSVGPRGCVRLREEIPTGSSCASSPEHMSLLDEIPDHSVQLFIIDESLSGSSIPDAVIGRKLVKGGGTIVSLSPFVTPRPFALQYSIPSTVMFETLTDVTGPFDSPQASLALSSALLPAPEGAMDALQFAQKIAESAGARLGLTGSSEELIKKRIAAVYASKRGTIFNASSASSQDVKQLGSEDDLWSALAEGGCWIDTETRWDSRRELSFRVMPFLKGAPPPVAGITSEPQTLLVVPMAETHPYAGTAVSPLMSKVSQESGLRLSAHDASMNPATAAAHQIGHGDTVALRTKNGAMNVRAKIDPRTMPDVIVVSSSSEAGGSARAIAPADTIHLLCEVSASGSYNPTPVTIQKAYL